MVNKSEFSILIVDDDKMNITVLTDILSKNYTIYIARSGEEALEKVIERKPDIILLDIIMPDLNGFDVLSRLKEMDDTRAIPVIIITGLANIEDEEKGFLLGAVDYIVKPFHASIIKARIHTHLTVVKQMHLFERFGLIDALTDIPNRRSFDIHMNMEWARAVREKMPISMLMIDIDNFKQYNDTYGHLQGDVMLQNCAQILTTTVKRTTDLVFRWGGEEFAVLLPNTDLNGALKVGEEIRANVSTAPASDISGGPVTYVTISVGAASIIPVASDLVTDFLLKVDKALYTAKRSGKNRVCI